MLLLRCTGPAARRRAVTRAAPSRLAASSLAEAYRLEGWVHCPGVLSSREVEALQRETDVLEQLASELTESGKLGGVFFEVQTASGSKHGPAVRPGALRKATGPGKRSAVFRALRTHAALLGLAREVAGVAQPRCVVDQVNFKAPGSGTGFPWHQDASFLIGDAAKALARHGGCNAVLALDASGPANGGFEVLGRTHTGGFQDLHGRYDTAGNNALFDATFRAAPTLLPGDVLLFHPNLAHGSGPNASALRRRLATLWFVGGG